MIRRAHEALDGVRIGYVYMGSAEEHPGAALVLRWGGNAELAVLFQDSKFCNLIQQGLIQIFFVDYRGYGWSEGIPSLAMLRSDAEAFTAALPAILAKHGLHAKSPVVLGRSIGAHCALHVAALGLASAVLLDSPAACHWPLESLPASLWRALPGVRLAPSVRQPRYCPCCPLGMGALGERSAMWLDPVDLVACVEAPLLVVCGTADTWCPGPQVQELFEAAGSHQKELVWIEDAGHNDLPLRPQYWDAMARFFASLDGEARGGPGKAAMRSSREA
mmetsp:Transcript_89512/g.208469  ORF Transcript_89512/g.208469 Transcript_89512/m.208469 type:complete len:276 (-) Transcript_89512:63-890(-)